MRRSRHEHVVGRGGHERGATAVESAILFAVLIVPLTFGFLDLGLRTFMKQEANAGARDAARVAIVDPGNTAKIKAAVTARAKVGTPKSISIVCSHPGGGTVACASALASVDTVKVTVTYDAFKIFFGIGTDEVVGDASMVIVHS